MIKRIIVSILTCLLCIGITSAQQIGYFQIGIDRVYSMPGEYKTFNLSVSFDHPSTSYYFPSSNEIPVIPFQCGTENPTKFVYVSVNSTDNSVNTMFTINVNELPIENCETRKITDCYNLVITFAQYIKIETGQSEDRYLCIGDYLSLHNIKCPQWSTIQQNSMIEVYHNGTYVPFKSLDKMNNSWYISFDEYEKFITKAFHGKTITDEYKFRIVYDNLFYTETVQLPSYYSKQEFSSDPTLYENQLTLPPISSDQQQVSIRNHDKNDIYYYDNGTKKFYNINEPSKQLETIPLSSGLNEIILDLKKNFSTTCPDVKHALVFDDVVHNYVDKQPDGSGGSKDFWSAQQADLDGRKGAISLTTKDGSLTDGQNTTLFEMPNKIIVDNTDYDTPNGQNNIITIPLLKNSFTEGKHEITITPDGCIPQTLEYTLEGYYENITPTYTLTQCNASNNKGKMLTISKIEGGLGGQYIIEGGDSFTLNDLPKSFDIPLGQGLTIKDKSEDIGVKHRQKTINLNDVTYTTPEIAINDILQPSCNGYNDGSISASINVGAKFEWSINPKPKQNGDNTEENNNTPPNQKIFSDISAKTYNISCTVDDCFVAEKNAIVINEPSKVEFITSLTHTTCEGKRDGIITISDLKEGNAQYRTSYKCQISNNAGYDKESVIIPWGNSSSFGTLSEGSYSVTVYQVDNNENKCYTTKKNIIISHEDPKLSYNIGSPSCADMTEPNGWMEILVAKKDDGSNYRFKPTTWTLNADKINTNRFNNLREGSYDVTASDGKCTVQLDNVTLEVNSYSFEQSSSTNVSCAEANNGTATIIVTKNNNGIFKPSEFIWELQDPELNNPSIPTTESSISNLKHGKYKVTVKHDEGCETKNPNDIVIGINDYKFLTEHHDLTCQEASNGDLSISLSVKNPAIDNGPFDIKDFSWTVKPLNSNSNADEKKYTPTSDLPVPDEDGNYDHDFTLSGLNEGVYNLSILHDGKCSQNIPVEVKTNQYTFQNSVRDISCSEAQNGEATIRIIQTGNGIYNSNNYQWSVVYSPDKITQTSSVVLKNLNKGMYTFSISHDDNKCVLSTTVDIGQNIYSHSVTTTNAPCADISLGSAIVQSKITKGSGIFDPIYTWSINGSKHSTGSSNTISELGFGSYSVKLEWANRGCSSELDFTIQHDILRPTLKLTNAECSDKESVGGKAEITMSPKRNYNYFWNGNTDGGESNTIENLPAGSHYVKVRDQYECIISVPFDILNSNFSADVKTENALCRQDATGKVTFDIKGGRGMYTINWNGNSNLSQNNISSGIFTQENIPVGIYQVDIKDETNCVVSHKVTISSGNLKVSHKESDASCASIGNAQAEITVTGAKLPVTYKWSDNVETSEPLRSNLSKGNYVVTVVDQNDCSMPVDINIYSKKLSAETAIDSATCGLAPDGAADIKLFSATFPVTFSWPDGKTTTDGKRSGLDKGNYDVLITDANGCEVHADIFIPHKGYLQNDVPSNINLCANGEITVDANEFDGYQWVFNGRNVDNNRFYTIKSPGTYIVKANGYDDCYAVDTIAVSMSSKSFSPYFRMSSVSYINDTLVVMEMSQTNPDKYSWKYDTLAFDLDNTKGSDRELRLIPKISGIYSITLSAENEDCVSDISKPVEIFATTRPDDDLSPLYVDNSIVKEFTISPNPTKGPITVEVNLSQIADVRLTIYDLNFGKIRKQVTLHNSDNYKLDINDVLYTGAYVVILQAGNETKQIKYIVGR